jgi:predicted nuclease of predicted toxin-antitoxin system
MNLLLETCVWAGATKVLAAAGHDVRWIGETDPDPGDEEIIRKAYNEGCVLITLDKDFGELAIVYGKPHRGIVRLVNIPGRRQAQYCVNVLERFEAELARGAILTVTSDRVRIRLAD